MNQERNNAVRRCKLCGAKLPADNHTPVCENCRKKMGRAGRDLIIVGTILLVYGIVKPKLGPLKYLI